MASYRPINGSPGRPEGPQMRLKPWVARRNRERIEYFIGYFETKEEAAEAEMDFDISWPPGKSSDSYLT